MKHFLTLFSVLLLSAGMFAFEYNGLNYRKVNETEVAVTKGDYSAAVNIPAIAFDEQNVAYFVTYIDDYAFYDAPIFGVSGGSSVQYIGAYAFYHTSVASIPDFPAVLEVGDRAFAHTLLTTLTANHFPLANKFGNYVFADCPFLVEATLPATLIHLGAGAFQNDIDLDNVRVLTTVLKYIPEDCFYNCEDLRSFHIMSCVDYIYSRAFYGCYSLDEISIPDGVKEVRSGAFGNCGQLRQVYINGANTKVDANAFAGSGNIRTIRLYYNANTVAPNQLFADSKGVISQVELHTGSDRIGTKNYSGNGAFQDFTALTTIDIREGVRFIGYAAFQGCKKLKEVNLPNSIGHISDNAFRDCPKLKTVNIPASVDTIGTYAFQNDSALVGIELPDGLKYIGLQAFKNSGLRTIRVPEKVEEINCFQGCWQLQEVDIPGKDTKVYASATGSSAFSQCEHIRKVSLCYTENTSALSMIFPNGYKNIREIELYRGSTTVGQRTELVDYFGCAGLSALEKITIPAGVKTIGNYAFSGCTSLKQITLPSTIEYISYGAFRDCKNLQRINLPSRIDTIGNNAFENTGLEAVVLPKSMKLIGNRAFAGCGKLKSVTLPDVLDYNGGKLFYNDTLLATITIPAGFPLSKGTFYGCTGLQSIVNEATVPQSIEWETVAYIDYATPVYVPQGSGSTYRAAYMWKNFKIIDDTECYTVETESEDETEGYVSGAGSYPEGTTVVIEAVPNEGYEFDCWDDGSTENPRTVTVQSGSTYRASFRHATAVRPATIEGLRVESGRIVYEGSLRIYDLLGRDVTAANGTLRGVYIAVAAHASAKVWVP